MQHAKVIRINEFGLRAGTPPTMAIAIVLSSVVFSHRAMAVGAVG